jgi:hypothetical protein
MDNSHVEVAQLVQEPVVNLSGYRVSLRNVGDNMSIIGTIWEAVGKCEQMKPKRLKPNDPIPGMRETVVGDFWSWGFSNPLVNKDRGVFAEFIVGHALGVVDGVRLTGWEAFDFVYEGSGIEVKSSAYIQAWPQKQLSKPSFDVEAKGAYDDELGRWDPEKRRRSSAYGFCLYPEADREKVNILDVLAWRFYVVPTQQIDAQPGSQKRVGLARV